MAEQLAQSLWYCVTFNHCIKLAHTVHKSPAHEAHTALPPHLNQKQHSNAEQTVHQQVQQQSSYITGRKKINK